MGEIVQRNRNFSLLFENKNGCLFLLKKYICRRKPQTGIYDEKNRIHIFIDQFLYNLLVYPEDKS
jgi:hypothetical protein